MKKLSVVAFFLAAFGAFQLAFAEESTEESTEKSTKENKPLELSIAVATAWYPESTHTTKSGTNFVGICGAFDSAKLAFTGAALYTLPFLQADNLLMENNHLTLGANLQVTPVTFKPSIELAFSPLAVLELKAGFIGGTGWYFSPFGAQGAGEYDIKKHCYETISPFQQWYLDAYGCAKFMFDVGAVWEGDWHHIVMTASYTAGYQKMTGTSEVWQWQANSYPMANGWIYEQDYFLGYQMPIALSLIGLDVTLSGHYKSSDFDVSGIADSYDGDFMQISLSPVAQIELNESGKDTLFILANISSRRSFSEKWIDWDTEPLLTKNGREFFFNCIGLQWKHIL